MAQQRKIFKFMANRTSDFFFVLIQRRYPLYLEASRSDARLLSRVLICDGMDFSERKNFVREICVCGKWKPFLISRSTFRSGNNTRKERYLSEVGRRKINAYKPLLGSAGVEVITERVPRTGTAGTMHRNYTPRHSCATNRRKKIWQL